MTDVGVSDLPVRSGTIDGVRLAVVTGLDDPDRIGRVKVRFPWLPTGTGDVEMWARVLAIAAGRERGIFFRPEIDDEVLVGFEAGRLERPFVLGGLWNKTDPPPSGLVDARNDRRSLTSRSGHVLRFDDTAGAEKIEIVSAGGCRIVIDDAAGSIRIEAEKNLEISAQGGDVTITGRNVNVTAKDQAVIKGGKVKIN